METNHNPQNQDNHGDRPTEQTAEAQPHAQGPAGRCAMDSVYSAIRKGANDARDAAEKALPKIKSAAADAGYWMSYGVAFAAVFQWTVAKQLTPDCFKSGYRDGVKAGKERAEKWLTERERRKEAAQIPLLAQPGSTVEGAQPGPA